MAWYRNHYHCGDCSTDWEDEWSCCCDDECPNCGSRNWSPVASEDLTEVARATNGGFGVYRSSDKADDRPKYALIATFPSAEGANRFIRDGEFT